MDGVTSAGALPVQTQFSLKGTPLMCCSNTASVTDDLKKKKNEKARCCQCFNMVLSCHCIRSTKHLLSTAEQNKHCLYPLSVFTTDTKTQADSPQSVNSIDTACHFINFRIGGYALATASNLATV